MRRPIRLIKDSVTSLEVTKLRKESLLVYNWYDEVRTKSGEIYSIVYSPTLVSETNSYSFAMGWRTGGRLGEDFRPGFLTRSNKGNLSEKSVEEIVRLISSDLDVVARNILEVYCGDYPTEFSNEGEGYWIKVLYCTNCNGVELHFMLKDKNSGKWVHKPNWKDPPEFVRIITEYTTEREQLLQSEMMSELSNQERDYIQNMLFKNDDATKVIPTKVEICQRDDEEKFLMISEYGLLLKYKTLCVMRISEP